MAARHRSQPVNSRHHQQTVNNQLHGNSSHTPAASADLAERGQGKLEFGAVRWDCQAIYGVYFNDCSPHGSRDKYPCFRLDGTTTGRAIDWDTPTSFGKGCVSHHTYIYAHTYVHTYVIGWGVVSHVIHHPQKSRPPPPQKDPHRRTIAPDRPRRLTFFSV